MAVKQHIYGNVFHFAVSGHCSWCVCTYFLFSQFAWPGKTRRNHLFKLDLPLFFSTYWSYRLVSCLLTQISQFCYSRFKNNFSRCFVCFISSLFVCHRQNNISELTEVAKLKCLPMLRALVLLGE